ncbi:hypothetical protein J9303_09465 [Bacillaceae bacterium Marseille-Q3522]|nr:hypothetical protein [Bacillaceae bacterium Marseille-Q3522]
MIIGLVAGILITLSPVMITGEFYSTTSGLMGNLLVADFVMRTLALIIGLAVIYDAAKNYLK